MPLHWVHPAWIPYESGKMKHLIATMKHTLKLLTSLLLVFLTTALLDCTAHAAQLDWNPDQINQDPGKGENKNHRRLHPEFHHYPS